MLRSVIWLATSPEELRRDRGNDDSTGRPAWAPKVPPMGPSARSTWAPAVDVDAWQGTPTAQQAGGVHV